MISLRDSARNAKSKGGHSGTNMYAYTQSFFAILATIDLDAPDAFLVDKQNRTPSTPSGYSKFVKSFAFLQARRTMKRWSQ